MSRNWEDSQNEPVGGDIVIISGEKYPVSPELVAVKARYDQLTTRQRKWFDAYMVNRNATLSSELAGYAGARETWSRMGTTNKEKMQDMIDVIDAEAKEAINAVTELTGIYQFWGTTLVDPTLSMRDRLKASELLARAMGAFDGENPDININISTEKFDKVESDVLEAFIIANSDVHEVPMKKNRFASDNDD